MPDGYRRTQRVRNSKQIPVRSVRVADELWGKAQRRAAFENVTMSQVLYAFVEGYAAGMLDLPKMQPVYTQVAQRALVAAGGDEGAES